MESKTPRTDAGSRTVKHTSYFFDAVLEAEVEVVDAKLARQLEKELAEARAEIENKQYSLVCDSERIQLLCEHVDELRAEIERKDKLIEQMREALLLFAEGAIHDFHYVCQHRDNCLCLACQKARVKAALAEERGVK